MPYSPDRWEIRKIAVIGPGIVGMPMAALLADAAVREGTDVPAPVLVVQRASPTSGWKVDAINAGKSPIGGVEPDLDRIVERAWKAGLLSATHDVGEVRDADVILVCVQTDKKGIAPDYGPLFEAVDGLAAALGDRPPGNVPLVIFESTLAPSSMSTVIRDRFAAHGLAEGLDLFLGNSPNRVMPGKLVARVAHADKVVAGLRPVTAELIRRLYSRIVTRGRLHATNPLTAEVVKTLENAYRDVRIAFSSEVARWCGERDIDFHQLRERVNESLAQRNSADSAAVPNPDLLIPTIGVGGHCLPKDGILLWWRLLEAAADTSGSLILQAREINDESPARTVALAVRHLGSMANRKVALLGTAYRPDSEDTRNSPTIPLAQLLLAGGAHVILHDPYVYERDQNLARASLTGRFTRDLDMALDGAELVFFCTAHRVYVEECDRILASPALQGMVDGCNLAQLAMLPVRKRAATGIGWGRIAPDAALVAEIEAAFRDVETGVANEVESVIAYLNLHYATDDFNRVKLADVQRIAGTCATGCRIVDPGPVTARVSAAGFASRLVARANAGAALRTTPVISTARPPLE